MTTTVTVAVDIDLPSGLAAEDISLRFDLSGVDTEGDTVIAPLSVTYEFATGAGDVDLWVNSEGAKNTYYSVTLIYTAPPAFGQAAVVGSRHIGGIALADAASYSLAERLRNSVIPGGGGSAEQALYDALLAARDQAVSAAGVATPAAIAASNSATSAAASSAAAGTASGRLVAGSDADMMAKFVTASPSAGQVVPALGDLITVIETDATYRVVSSGEQRTTTGGVKLAIVPKNGAFRAADFNAAPADDKTYLYGPGFKTSGTELYNFPADDYQRVIGQEYLAAFHTRATTAQSFRIRFWGDSRVAGSGQSGNFLWHQAFRQAARRRGYYRGVYENNAIGGTTIQQWTDTHSDTFLTGTNDPHLVVFCAGINDLDLGAATPAQVVARLDAFLTKIRVTKAYPLATLSVAVVVPVSAYNPSRSRDPRFIEPVRDGFRRLARKHQVCLIDGYAIAADGRNQRGLGYAADIGAPEVIHQNNVGMIPILDQLINAVLPDLTPYQGGGLSIESGSGQGFIAADLPSAYPQGISLFRATPGGGGSNWPVDGFVQTINHVDDIQTQWNFATGSNDPAIWFRKGRSNAWGSWVQVVTQSLAASGPSAVTAASGFVAPGTEAMRTIRNGNTVTTDGYLTVSPAATIAANTTIGTITTGWRPAINMWGVEVAAWNGTTWVYPRARVNADGTIVLMDAVAITATRVYLNGVSWAAA